MKTRSYSPSFSAQLNTLDVLGVTTQKVLYSGGMNGIKKVLNTFCEKPIVGNRGFKYHAQIIGEKITGKYPKLKSATDELNSAFSDNPENVQTVLDKIKKDLGENIDIII